MWTASSTAFMYEQQVSFVFTTTVSWDYFWTISYIWSTEPDLILSKIGHLVGSFILGLLFYYWLGVRRGTLLTMVFLVSIVEITQELFTRDSMFLDMLINLAGIALAALFLSYVTQKMNKLVG